ncbi:MAG: hypothetical protein JNL13_11770 [Chitinophagaceae bacterium]|nr:hypothetical protein [Chitinophagaceae bacterium]
MIKRIFHSIIVGGLAILLLFGASAKEFVHLFAHHEDTHHTEHVCPPGETHFEAPHHHCSFLHFVLESFTGDVFFPRVDYIPSPVFTTQHSTVAAKFIPCSVHSTSTRGPPMA